MCVMCAFKLNETFVSFPSPSYRRRIARGYAVNIITQTDLHYNTIWVIIIVMAKGDKLTAQQEQFCLEFIKDLNAVRAAIRAGYGEQHAKKNAWTIIRNPAVAERISELKADQTKRTKIEADDILRRLVRIAEKTEQEGDYQAAIRSLELLGKHQAMWTDKNLTEMEVKNAFATGNSEEDIIRDVERLKKIAAPHLKLVIKKESIH
jgi:phage terminase small subunit